jgi:Type IV secretion-system coupling protein DNA-binding domain
MSLGCGFFLSRWASIRRGPSVKNAFSYYRVRQLLRQVQVRNETAIVYDPAMDFVGEFYSPVRGDLILNPLDARCPYWGLGDELDRC